MTSGRAPDGRDGSNGGGRADPTARPDGGSVETASRATALSPLWPRLLPGLLLGVAAFLGTYAVAYSLRASYLDRSALPVQMAATTPETPRLVGWLVYRAHLVPIEYDIQGTLSDAHGTVRAGEVPVVLERLAAALEPGVLVAVPVAMLFVCGFYAAIELDAYGPRVGGVAGATVVVGYLLAVTAAVVVTDWRVSQSLIDTTVTVAIGPAEWRAVALAGVVYPLVGGAVGGVVAGTLGTDWSPATD